METKSVLTPVRKHLTAEAVVKLYAFLALSENGVNTVYRLKP